MRQPTKGQAPQPSPPRHGLDWRVLILVFIVMGMSLFWLGSMYKPAITRLSYSQFKQQLRSGHIKKITMQNQEIQGLFTQDYVKSKQGPSPAAFKTLPPIDDPELMGLLEQHHVDVEAETGQASWWQSLVIGLLPWVLIIGPSSISARACKNA